MAEIVSPVQVNEINQLRSELMFETWKRLVGVLSQAETKTIIWVTHSLRGINDLHKISSFTLPMAGRISVIYKGFFQEAYSLGGRMVYESAPGATIMWTGRTNLEAKAKSALATDRFVSNIEGDLKWEWERSLTRRVDKPMLIYRTELVFAKIGGWNPPNAPSN